jgi:hypothetical protein
MYNNRDPLAANVRLLPTLTFCFVNLIFAAAAVTHYLDLGILESFFFLVTAIENGC